MHPCAKGHVLFDLARRIKPVRPVPDIRVAARRAQQQADLIPPFEIMPKEPRVLIHPAFKQMQRRIKTQQLFYRAVDCVWAKRGLRRALFQQRFYRIPERVDRRLMPSVHEQYTGRNELICRQLIPCILCRDQFGDQVIAGPIAPLRHVMA